jgi:predicted TIM-barrel fold metal-dependent hydrolase
LLAANAPDLLLYASRYPFTDGALPETFQCMTEAERSRILQRNAAELYKLPIQDH